VSDIGLRRPTLDDVFLNLTGAPPGEDGAGGGHPPARAPRRRRSALRARPIVRQAVLASFRPSLSGSARRSPMRAWSPVGTCAISFASHSCWSSRPSSRSCRSAVRYVFGGAVTGSLPGGVKYIEFLPARHLVQSVAFRATQNRRRPFEDLERGVIDRFRSMPMARSAVLVGRTTADLVRNVLIIVLMTWSGTSSASVSRPGC